MQDVEAAVPILAGIGIVEQRVDEVAAAKSPIELMIASARAAIEDAGLPANSIGEIMVPRGRWSYADPAGLVAEAIGATNAATLLADVGVLQQSLISRACRRIAAGELDCAMVVGGEAGYRLLRAGIEGVELGDEHCTGDPGPGRPDTLLAPADLLFHPAELAGGFARQAVSFYAAIETAYCASNGLSFDDRRRAIAETYSAFSRTAVNNPHAWDRRFVSADEIFTIDAKNRYIAFPYSRRHVTSWSVDQASALLLCSEAVADQIGVPKATRVYPVASAESNYMCAVVQRPEIGQCPGARIAGKALLDAADMTIDEIDTFEFYSCFPIAVDAYAEAVGVSPDARLSFMGGMSFAGGPFNNYVLQATCRLAELMRQGKSTNGLITTVSGLLTKQALGLWSRTPPNVPFTSVDVSDRVAAAQPPVPVIQGYCGPATIAAYTVQYDKGQPRRAVIIADAPDGGRCVAMNDDARVMAALQDDQFCGRAVVVTDRQFALG